MKQADRILIYFKQKIDKIHASFKEPTADLSTRLPDANIKLLSIFEPTTAEEIRKIVNTFGVKCSPEDPAPAPLLSTNMDTLLPFWVEIVNLSLETGSMDCLKSAVLLPLIKELSKLIDTENLKNYRPVSNLVFISKLVERVVDVRLQKHLESNNLMIDNQYGYKKSHSTEYLLLKVINGLFESCDRNIPSIVLLLDLSAAFDTVDHTKLLTILRQEIGVDSVALEWFTSFLTNRTQKFKIGNSYSETSTLSFGVPQGSILGPRLFNIYIRSIYTYIEPTKFKIKGFADDHQLVKQFLVSMQCEALGDTIRQCLERIAIWMKDHFLCLNQSKTKILVVAPPAVKEKILVQGVLLDDSCIRFVDSAKNLGVILDNVLSFENQITKVAKTCFSIIRRLSKIKVFLSQKQLQMLVSSYVFSRLDYCNSLYYGLNSNLIRKLQHVQNCAARLISKNRIQVNSSLDHILLGLHWLKVRDRIIYKILLIVHNCLHWKAPNEIIEIVRYAESERTMKQHETKTINKYGDRAFSHIAPKLWNLLPYSIRGQHETLAFKKQLKSFLLTRGDEFVSWIKRR